MAKYAAPEGYILDHNSGNFYSIVTGTDASGQTKELVTWFNPDSGQYSQVMKNPGEALVSPAELGVPEIEKPAPAPTPVQNTQRTAAPTQNTQRQTAAAPQPKKASNGKKTGLIIGIVAAALVLIGLAVYFIGFRGKGGNATGTGINSGLKQVAEADLGKDLDKVNYTVNEKDFKVEVSTKDGKTAEKIVFSGVGQIDRDFPRNIIKDKYGIAYSWVIYFGDHASVRVEYYGEGYEGTINPRDMDGYFSYEEGNETKKFNVDFEITNGRITFKNITLPDSAEFDYNNLSKVRIIASAGYYKHEESTTVNPIVNGTEVKFVDPNYKPADNSYYEDLLKKVQGIIDDTKKESADKKKKKSTGNSSGGGAQVPDFVGTYYAANDPHSGGDVSKLTIRADGTCSLYVNLWNESSKTIEGTYTFSNESPDSVMTEIYLNLPGAASIGSDTSGRYIFVVGDTNEGFWAGSGVGYMGEDIGGGFGFCLQ